MQFTKPRFLRELTPRLLRVFLCASIGAMNFGYDNNWWAGVIGQQAFIDDYGRKNGDGEHRTLPSSWLSAASGTPLAGWIIGCLLAGYLTRSIGRKWTIVVVCVIAIVGMVIQCVVLNYWVLTVGRLINAFSMGIEANCVPMYMAELAPPAIRGGMVNFYQSWLYVGALLAAATVYGSSQTLTGTWSYRTAIVVQLGPPCMLLAAVWLIPESPRWLLSKGRKAEALKALIYMRKGSSNEEEAATEVELIDLAIQEEKQHHEATSYVDCFKGTNFRRTLVAIGVQVLQQAQGNSFTTTYLVIFLQQVGVKQPLLINVAKMAVNLGATITTFFLTDKIGRRPMMMGGSFFMAALMWVVSATSAFTPGGLSDSAAQGIIAAILLYGAFAASCWGSVMWTVTTEVSTTQLRERTIAIATLLGFTTSLLITYINPFVQNEPGNLGAKVGMIYGSISLLALVFVFFFVPEMKGRSLEEIDELFHANIPAWKTKAYVCTGLGTQITNIQNIEGTRPSLDAKIVNADIEEEAGQRKLDSDRREVS